MKYIQLDPVAERKILPATHVKAVLPKGMYVDAYHANEMNCSTRNIMTRIYI